MFVQNPEAGRLVLLLGVAANREFETRCGSLLAEAHTRRSNPIDGQYARVERGDRFGDAAASLLVVSGLLRDIGADIRDGARLYALTELGDSAYERLERSWKQGTKSRS